MLLKIVHQLDGAFYVISDHAKNPSAVWRCRQGRVLEGTIHSGYDCETFPSAVGKIEELQRVIGLSPSVQEADAFRQQAPVAAYDMFNHLCFLTACWRDFP